MLKAVKIASMGLGICCLTLSLSGVSRASQVDICGTYGKHFDTSCRDLDNCKFQEIEDCWSKYLCDHKDIKDDNGKGDDKNGCDKDEKHDCKVTVDDHKDCLPKDCAPKDCDDKHDDGGCDVKPPCDSHPPCTPPPSCDPHAVPAPAASLTSGFGVICVALLGWLKNRRSVRA